MILSIVVIDRDSEFQPPLVALHAYRPWKSTDESLGRLAIQAAMPPNDLSSCRWTPVQVELDKRRWKTPRPALPSEFDHEVPQGIY